jgi:hypothetical protein
MIGPDMFAKPKALGPGVVARPNVLGSRMVLLKRKKILF